MRLVTDRDSADYTTDISESNLADRILNKGDGNFVVSFIVVAHNSCRQQYLSAKLHFALYFAHFNLKCATEKICTKQAKN